MPVTRSYPIHGSPSSAVYADSDLDWDGLDDWNSGGADGDLFAESYNANTGLSGSGRVSSPTVASRLGYAGYQWDDTINAYHVRHRVYMPEIGRWTRRDPIGYLVGNATFQYVEATPLVSNDPLGLVSQASITVGRAPDERPRRPGGGSLPDPLPPREPCGDDSIPKTWCPNQTDNLRDCYACCYDISLRCIGYGRTWQVGCNANCRARFQYSKPGGDQAISPNPRLEDMPWEDWNIWAHCEGLGDFDLPFAGPDISFSHPARYTCSHLAASTFCPLMRMGHDRETSEREALEVFYQCLTEYFPSIRPPF